MKQKSFTRLIYFLAFATITCCLSCKKSTPTDNTRRFTWTCKGTTYTASWDSAFIHSMSTTPVILAGNGAGAALSAAQLAISLSSFRTGTYPAGSGNEMKYTDDAGHVFFGISGTVTITAFANNRVSGEFSVGLAGPSASFPITGNFTNTPVAP